VLVTRAEGQGSELAERLAAAGATPILIPAIEIVPPSSFKALDESMRGLAEFDLVAFTSANAVRAMEGRAKAVGVRLAPKGIAVVGPATARAVEAMGLRVDVMPTVYTAEALGEALRDEVSGRRVLLAIAEGAPATLRDALVAAGAEVTVAAAYANRIPADSVEALRELFASELPDAVTFTSASTAVNLVALMDAAGVALPESVVRASIGPVTSEALRGLGLPPHVEAAEATIAALVAAIVEGLAKL
jgi:uroporphyrinogen-III synthase